MPKTVLIVEDDNFLRETIRSALEEKGVLVTEAQDGLHAVECLQKEKPDLVLLDLLMPREDGFFVLKHIRENMTDVSVVILSNLSSDMTPEKCIALGAKDYLVKSDMDEDELWPRIQHYL